MVVPTDKGEEVRARVCSGVSRGQIPSHEIPAHLLLTGACGESPELERRERDQGSPKGPAKECLEDGRRDLGRMTRPVSGLEPEVSGIPERGRGGLGRAGTKP